MSSSQEVLPAAAATPSRTNWAGNYAYTSARCTEPGTAAEVASALQGAAPIKALGTRHSFNHIADTPGTQIDLRRLKMLSLDRERQVALVGAGISYGELAPWLDAQGFAVHNMASLPHISVAGACATATHGSGTRNGCLSTAVVALELLDAQGRQHRLSRTETPEAFRAAAAGLGAFGVVLHTELHLEPRFDVAQTVYEDLSFEALERHLPEVFSAGYSVSVFTDWQHHRATQIWLKQMLNEAGDVDIPRDFFGARKQTKPLHPLPVMPAEYCTEQLGVPGPWLARLPHFRLDYTPSAGAELQTEYFVPLERGYEAIQAVEALRDRITPLLLISELRTVAADDLMMSMAHGRDSLAIHFTWKQELAPVLALLPTIEAALEPFAARPHWAKLFTMTAGRIRALYPDCETFRRYARQYDPNGKCRNTYLNEVLDL